MARKKNIEALEAAEAPVETSVEATASNLVLSNPGVNEALEAAEAPASPRRVRTINGMTIIDN